MRLEVDRLKQQGKQPGLAVILVGDDPASQVYVNMKGKACEKAGIRSITEHHPATLQEQELLQRIEYFNRNSSFHGLLVQLPLPSHINAQKIIEAVEPQKDVDCFHPYNVGRLMIGQPIFEPATPAGIMELLRRNKIQPAGRHVVILGRSNIVGKPIAMMMLQKHPEANAVVTVVHTGAQDISRFTRQADILIAAVGKAEVVRGDMVRDGVVVIDVGVNRVEADNEKGYRLVGDVCFEEVSAKAAAITPVPGGVGPMTIAMLLKNTLKAFYLQEGRL
ncbi:MAG: bifunctional methylenetetrahydrofolate dehydrogenase/methenyltetrahydrofolate cyclohydrolase FolD [Calditrichia bacterium]